MASLNKVMLIGNLTRDPETRYTPKGAAVCEIGLAINRHWTTDAGERREECTFVDVTLWKRQAEVAEQYLKKGSPVFIEGRLELSSWDDRETGQKRTKLKIIGENMQFLGGKPDGQSSNYPAKSSNEARNSSPAARRPDPAPETSGYGAVDDDIPF